MTGANGTGTFYYIPARPTRKGWRSVSPRPSPGRGRGLPGAWRGDGGRPLPPETARAGLWACPSPSLVLGLSVSGQKSSGHPRVPSNTRTAERSNAS